MSVFSGEKDPFKILKQWVDEARNSKSVLMPDAMLLSSFSLCSLRGRRVIPHVSSRVVLLKEMTEERLLFYTNYRSLKSWQITLAWVGVALNFYWPALGKQIRLEGKVSKISRKKSLLYWESRSFESQVSQYISKQSQILKSRSYLEQEWRIAKRKFDQNEKVPCPSHWGGYAFTPRLIEFWEDRPHRLHERVQFIKQWRLFSKKDKWTSFLLYP